VTSKQAREHSIADYEIKKAEGQAKQAKAAVKSAKTEEERKDAIQLLEKTNEVLAQAKQNKEEAFPSHIKKEEGIKEKLSGAHDHIVEAKILLNQGNEAMRNAKTAEERAAAQERITYATTMKNIAKATASSCFQHPTRTDEENAVMAEVKKIRQKAGVKQSFFEIALALKDSKKVATYFTVERREHPNLFSDIVKAEKEWEEELVSKKEKLARLKETLAKGKEALAKGKEISRKAEEALAQSPVALKKEPHEVVAEIKMEKPLEEEMKKKEDLEFEKRMIRARRKLYEKKRSAEISNEKGKVTSTDKKKIKKESNEMFKVSPLKSTIASLQGKNKFSKEEWTALEAQIVGGKSSPEQPKKVGKKGQLEVSDVAHIRMLRENSAA